MSDAIRYTIGVDGSNAVSGIKDIQDQTIQTGKVIEDVFGRKLKQVISVVAIEQAAQKTGEWPQAIEQTAKHLGTTAEQLQTLNHIASQTGNAESDVQGLFSNIQAGALAALQGNSELITSFKTLGISIGDIRSMNSSQLFDKVMKNTAAMGPDVRKLDVVHRQAIDNITGTPENTFQSIQVIKINLEMD
jgi:hypothetical protein